MALRRELSDDMDQKQLEATAKYRTKIIQLLSQHNPQGRIPRNINPELYSKLEEFEIYLRKIMKAKGYKTRYQVGAASALQA